MDVGNLYFNELCIVIDVEVPTHPFYMANLKQLEFSIKEHL